MLDIQLLKLSNHRLLMLSNHQPIMQSTSDAYLINTLRGTKNKNKELISVFVCVQWACVTTSTNVCLSCMENGR